MVLVSPQVCQSRFCSVEAPSGWRVVPGAGLLGRETGGVRRSAVVCENWMDPAIDSAAFVERQREVLGRECPRSRVVEEHALPPATLGDARLLVVRTELETGGVLLQKQLTTVAGPLACTLTLSGSEVDSELWETDAVILLGSFAVPSCRWASAIRQFRWAPAVETEMGVAAAELVTVRAAGIRIPLLPGWEVDGDVGICCGEATVRVRRSDLASSSAEVCFADALHRIERMGKLSLDVWGRGTTARGKPVYLVGATASSTPTWGAPKRTSLVQAFVGDEGVIAFQALAPTDLETTQRVVRQLVEGYEWVEPAERTLDICQTWLPARLTGRWTEVSPGIYLKNDPPQILLVVAEMPRSQGIEVFSEGQVAAIRSGPDVATILREESAAGAFRGRDAFRYSLEYLTADGRRVSLRACCIDADWGCCAIIAKGAEQEAVHQLWCRLLDELRPERLRRPGTR